MDPFSVSSFFLGCFWSPVEILVGNVLYVLVFFEGGRGSLLSGTGVYTVFISDTYPVPYSEG